MTRTIMTVDDSTSMRQMVKPPCNRRVRSDRSRRRPGGAEYARQNSVDLVISDVNMPRMDALRWCMSARAASYRLTPCCC